VLTSVHGKAGRSDVSSRSAACGLVVSSAVLAMASWACTPGAITQAPESVAGPAIEDTADTVIDLSRVGETVTLKVGQVIRVVRPRESRWQVDYASDILTMLTPADEVPNPGPDGWRLQAAKPGETVLQFTMIVQTGNPMVVGYTVRVVQ